MHRRGFSCHLVERSTMRIRYLHAVLVLVGLPQSLLGLENEMGNNRDMSSNVASNIRSIFHSKAGRMVLKAFACHLLRHLAIRHQASIVHCHL
jgi:hypothetical protein